jgi:hypothetical protein
MIINNDPHLAVSRRQYRITVIACVSEALGSIDQIVVAVGSQVPAHRTGADSGVHNGGLEQRPRCAGMKG